MLTSSFMARYISNCCRNLVDVARSPVKILGGIPVRHLFVGGALVPVPVPPPPEPPPVMVILATVPMSSLFECWVGLVPPARRFALVQSVAGVLVSGLGAHQIDDLVAQEW